MEEQAISFITSAQFWYLVLKFVLEYQIYSFTFQLQFLPFINSDFQFETSLLLLHLVWFKIFIKGFLLLAYSFFFKLWYNLGQFQLKCYLINEFLSLFHQIFLSILVLSFSALPKQINYCPQISTLHLIISCLFIWPACNSFLDLLL